MIQFEHISERFQSILDNLKVVYPDTLFPLEWNNIKYGRCPICSCKLHQVNPLNGGVWICKSTKHKRQFAIKNETYQQLQYELKTKSVV